MKKNLLAAIGFLLPLFLYSQDRFYVDADFRTRGMYTHGYTAPLNPDEAGTFWIGQRARVGFGYDRRRLGLYIELEGTFAWGQTERRNNPVSFNISQAFFYMDFGKGFGMKLGRRPLYVEDSRFVSTSGWAEAFGTHDVLEFYFNSADGKAKVNMIGSASDSRLDEYTLHAYQTSRYYKYWAFVYGSYQFTDDIRWSLLFSNHWEEHSFADSATDPRLLHGVYTVGTYIDLCKGRKVSALLNGYGQWGENRYGRKYSAYLASFVLTATPVKRFEIKAGYDYTTKDFNKFLGSNHIFLGLMDYFGSVDGPADGLCDLHQPYLQLTGRVHEKHTLELAARYFFSSRKQYMDPGTWSQNEIMPTYFAPENFSSDLGCELSLTYKYQIHEDLTFDIGYAWHSKTDLLDYLFDAGRRPGWSKTAHYGFVMLRYKPTLFDSEKRHKKE